MNTSNVTNTSVLSESSADGYGLKKKRRSLFDRKSKISCSSGDADISANTERDVTPGSLEVWVDLPDEIKYDPSLAPFRHRYEEHHGKLDTSQTNMEGDKTIFQREADQPTTGTANALETEFDPENRQTHPMNAPDEKHITNDKNKLDQTIRVIKLATLVAGWLLLTMSLLLNREKTDVVLHTAVHGGIMKEYSLRPSDERFSLLITLTGPFAQPSNHSSNHDQLHIWLARKHKKYEQNSTSWSITLQPPQSIDFSESVTETRTLRLEELKNLVKDDTDGEVDGEESSGFVDVNNETMITLNMYTSSDSTVPLTVTYQLNPMEERDGIIYSTTLLCLLYILIIFEIVNRTIAALLSSSLGVAVLAVNGVRPSLPELVSWLDVETLLLLFSMMLLVAILADTGLFDRLAVLAFETTKGKTWPLINCLCFFTAIFSTFLDNVTTVLLMTPVTIRLCEVMQLNPVPVLMSMVLFSNVGGAATPVGDPPNLIIASHPAILRQNINFTTFTLHMGLGILLVSIQTYLQLRYMFRDISKLRHSVPVEIQEMRQEIAVWRRAASSLSTYSRDEDIVRKALEKQVNRLNMALSKIEAGKNKIKNDAKFSSTLAEMKQKYYIRDKPLLIKSTICLLFVITVFFLHAFPELQRLSLGWTALLGALLLLLLAETSDLEPVLARVEWSTLLFFAALFVLMEALSKMGLISWIGNIIEAIISNVSEDSQLAVAIMLILWVSGLASAFVDNIPLTTMMVRVIAKLSDPSGLALPLSPLAWALSFGACLGGNGTLIGASANVVCAGVAEQHGYRFTFVEFLKIGFPIMIGNLVVASVFLLFCHCVFTWH